MIAKFSRIIQMVLSTILSIKYDYCRTAPQYEQNLTHVIQRVFSVQGLGVSTKESVFQNTLLL